MTMEKSESIQHLVRFYKNIDSAEALLIQTIGSKRHVLAFRQNIWCDIMVRKEGISSLRIIRSIHTVESSNGT
jgi:hypothetical protein